MTLRFKTKVTVQYINRLYQYAILYDIGLFNVHPVHLPYSSLLCLTIIQTRNENKTAAISSSFSTFLQGIIRFYIISHASILHYTTEETLFKPNDYNYNNNNLVLGLCAGVVT
jgi:hypothetical protein